MTALEEFTLEEQLRAELRAEAETVTPDSIRALHLPEQRWRSPATLRRALPRQWPNWTKPLAAAAAVVAVIGGTFAAGGSITGPASAARPAATHLRPPTYYAYTVQGSIYNYASHGTQYAGEVGGRYLKVRATGTGKLVDTVSPPKPDNAFSLVTADASGGMFVLGAMRYWQTSASSTDGARNQRTPMSFSVLRITPEGRPRLSGLALPELVTPAQKPSIALSPDGARLAMAVGGGSSPAVVRVITLATGRQQKWEWRGVSWTPHVNSNGAWTANGRTLAFSEWVYSSLPAASPARPGQASSRPSQPSSTRVHLLDTIARNTSSPASDRLVVMHPVGAQAAQGQVFLTPDGTALIGAVIVQWLQAKMSTGSLAIYSVRTGAHIASVGSWAWPQDSPPGHAGVPRQTVAWSNESGSQLIVLQPRYRLNTLGVLTGRTLSTASALLPQQPSGYAELQYALRQGTQLAW